MGAGHDARQPSPPLTTPREPQRTCVGCRQRGDRSRLLRVVADRVVGLVPVVPDPGARLPGRGAWVHPALACLDLAERRRAFSRALRVQGPVDASAVREHLQHHEHRPDTPSESTESGSSPDGHPMSSLR